MKRLSPKTILAVIAAVALAALIVFSKSPSLHTRTSRAAERGARWLFNYKGALGDPGILWAVKETDNAYCGNNAADSFIASRVEEFTSGPDAPYLALLGPRYAESVSAADIVAAKKPYDDMLLPALYCNFLPLPAATQENILDVATATGYDLTHRFLALLFLKENSCGDQTSRDEAISSSRAKLREEILSAGSFDDVYAERIALLSYGGFRSDISPNWIETMLAAQSANGSWGSGLLFGKNEDPHATALSVWALSMYAGTCPFQN